MIITPHNITPNPSRTGVTGLLQPGLAADLLLVEGDPLIDISVLTEPVEIFARGQPLLDRLG